jgi:hypothetical protein
MPTKYICQYCEGTFTRKYSLNRHLETRCLAIKDPSVLLELLKDRQDEIDKLNEHIELIGSNIKDKIIVVKIDDKKKRYKQSGGKYAEINTKARNDYVYVIKEREFIKSGENIYKIGRTERGYHKRVSQYPNNSIVFEIVKVPDAKKYESVIKKVFIERFRQRKDIGFEYFEANILDIRKMLHRIIRRLDKIYD